MLQLIRLSSKSFGVILSALLFFGCAQQKKQPKKKPAPGPKVTKAVATINAAKGEDVAGTVTFTKKKEGVEVVAQLKNLSQGKHGFHVHQYGNCSDKDGFSSSGGHYNPTKQPHGAPTADKRHVGDMGNVPVGPEGKGEITYMDPMIELNGKHSVVGRAVIIHAGQDDFETQPSGASGAQIGCGVIGITSTKPDTAKGSGNM